MKESESTGSSCSKLEVVSHAPPTGLPEQRSWNCGDGTSAGVVFSARTVRVRNGPSASDSITGLLTVTFRSPSGAGSPNVPGEPAAVAGRTEPTVSGASEVSDLPDEEHDDTAIASTTTATLRLDKVRIAQT